MNGIDMTPLGLVQVHYPFPYSVLAVYRVGTLGFVPSEYN